MISLAMMLNGGGIGIRSMMYQITPEDQEDDQECYERPEHHCAPAPILSLTCVQVS